MLILFDGTTTYQPQDSNITKNEKRGNHCIVIASRGLAGQGNKSQHVYGTSSCIQNKSQLRTSTSKSHLATIRRIIGSQHKTKLEKDGNTCVQSREGCRRGWGEGGG